MDAQIEVNRQILKTKPQTYFDIDEKNSLDWSIPILELNELNNHLLPYKKAQCILQTVCAIVDVVKLANNPNVRLSAEDLLPVSTLDLNLNLTSRL